MADCEARYLRQGNANDPEALQLAALHALILQSIPGREAEAIEKHQHVFSARQATLGPDHPDTLTAAFNLADQLEKARRYEEALVPAKVALDGLQARRVKDSQAPRTLGVYGLTMFGLKRYDEAEAPLRQSLELRRQGGQTKTKTFARIADALAVICSETGRESEADSLRREAAAAIPTTRPATSRSSH